MSLIKLSPEVYRHITVNAALVGVGFSLGVMATVMYMMNTWFVNERAMFHAQFESTSVVYDEMIEAYAEREAARYLTPGRYQATLRVADEPVILGLHLNKPQIAGSSVNDFALEVRYSKARGYAPQRYTGKVLHYGETLRFGVEALHGEYQQEYWQHGFFKHAQKPLELHADGTFSLLYFDPAGAQQRLVFKPV